MNYYEEVLFEEADDRFFASRREYAPGPEQERSLEEPGKRAWR